MKNSNIYNYVLLIGKGDPLDQGFINKVKSNKSNIVIGDFNKGFNLEDLEQLKDKVNLSTTINY